MYRLMMALTATLSLSVAQASSAQGLKSFLFGQKVKPAEGLNVKVKSLKFNRFKIIVDGESMFDVQRAMWVEAANTAREAKSDAFAVYKKYCLMWLPASGKSGHQCWSEVAVLPAGATTDIHQPKAEVLRVAEVLGSEGAAAR